MSDQWDDARVANWLRQADGLERQLQPVSDVLFAAASLQPGEWVLDVGCGTGPTTRDAAVAVGADGLVRGLDVAGEMLRAAATVPLPAGAAPIEWVEADPVTWTPTPDELDVVLSRFGVMFFSEPAAAFASLARATRPGGGRLAIATWARRDESPLFTVPYRAALAELGRSDELPDDAGPFSLHDPAALAALLGDAGWTRVATAVHVLPLPFGGGITAPEAAATALGFGPTRIVTADLEEADRQRVAAAITEAFADHVDDEGHVVLEGTVLITTAHRPAP